MKLWLRAMIQRAADLFGVAPLGFISRYTDYADIREAPGMMHRITAIQMVASLLNRNGVTIKQGADTHTLDLWVALLSESGGGRSTLTNAGRLVLESAGVAGLVRTHMGRSEVAFYQDMAENPTGLFVWGELSQKLAMMNDAKFAGLKVWITDRYDSMFPPDDITYRVTGKSSDTPPVVFKTAPRINILATSSEDWFFKYIQTSDSTGGFLPRWIFVRGKKVKYVPTPRPPNEEKGRALAKELKVIAGLDGPADISEILPLYERDWYEKTARRFESQPSKSLADAYWNRHRVHILKLAVIFEAARSYSLKVTEASWKLAVKTAGELEKIIFDLLSTGMTAAGFELQKAEELIRAAKATGMSKTEYTRALQHERDRDKMLQTLIDAEKVKSFTQDKSGLGRKPVILIHRDFW